MDPKWSKQKLEEIANVYGGGTPPTNNPKNFRGNINWFTPTELPGDSVEAISESNRKISQAAQHFTTVSEPGTVLLSTRATIGNVGILSTASGYNQGIKGIEPNEGKVDPWYLGYWLKANKDKLLRKSFGTTFKEISTSAVRDLELLLPPIAHQKKIVCKLDAIRKAQKLNDKAISKTEEFFSSLLHEEFSMENDNGATGTVGNLVEKVTDGAHNVPPLTNSGVPLLDSTYIDNLEIDITKANKFISNETDAELSSRCKPKEGDILISSRGSIGKLALVKRGQDFNIMANIALVRPGRELLPKYILYFLLSAEGRNRLGIRSYGTSQKALYIKDIKKVEVPTLTKKGQEKIVEELDGVREYKKVLLRRKELLQELFDSVLDKSMKGKAHEGGVVHG